LSAELGNTVRAVANHTISHLGCALVFGSSVNNFLDLFEVVVLFMVNLETIFCNPGTVLDVPIM
jgi:hypothetical protein